MFNLKFSLRSTLLTVSMAVTTGFFSVFAAAPAGYYSSCEGKSGASLLTALNQKISSHTTVSYKNLYDVYETSDIDANGKIWDIYSTKRWNLSGPRCGNYQKVGDCYNREHSFPKSWFNDASPMYSDAYHIYPTDGKVNGQRSNYPYGECANGTTLPSNGGVDALGKLGTSTFAGYSKTVFEPIDEFKGDLARGYFYMAACYNDKIATWKSDMLAGNRYPAFSSWALNLLLKWHRQDPVSQKELDRNEAVYAHQKNRNPFIDHPELVEYIWGTKQTSAWSEGAGLDPEIKLPMDGSTIDLGSVSVNVARTTTIIVRGSALKDAVSLSVSGAPFSVSPAAVSTTAANSADGAKVTVSCKATAPGTYSGKLFVKSGDLSTTVTLKAAAYDGLPATAPTNISDVSFVAHWTNIGDADANGCYTITVLESNGEVCDTYPRSAKAADEAYLVDELLPSTDYSYYLTTASGIKSNVINVRTADPIPSIQLLYDGELSLNANPGEPSDAAEIILDVENISENIVISVAEPFELSSDKGEWSTTLSVAPTEDRFFLRVNSAKIGVFTTTIKAQAGDYMTDDAEVTASVTEKIAFLEDFENGAAKGGYNDTGAEVTATMGQWFLTNAGHYASAAEAYAGEKYLRLGKKENSVAYTITPKKNGAGTISFYAATWAADEGGDLDVQTSTDGGSTWTSAGVATVSGNAKEYKKYTVTANVAGDVQLKLAQKTGGRILIDNIEITDYSAGIDGVVSDYRSWTAYSAGGRLVVELGEASRVAVHGVDGITYFNGDMHAGANTLDLAKGLYIVVVDDFSRRVLVK